MKNARLLFCLDQIFSFSAQDWKQKWVAAKKYKNNEKQILFSPAAGIKHMKTSNHLIVGNKCSSYSVCLVDGFGYQDCWAIQRFPWILRGKTV